MRKIRRDFGIHTENYFIDLRFNLLLIINCFIILFMVLICSCKENEQNKIINEGEIKYQIQYLDDEQINSLIPLLPNEVTTSFKNNSSRTIIEGLFGTFKLIYVINESSKSNLTLLQILDKKYVYPSGMDEMAFGYKEMKKVKIQYTNKLKKIAGYKCKHAKAIFENGIMDTIDIYYTNDIALFNANLNNPFKEINGVLMEFSVNLVDINMKFTAKKVIDKKIDDKLFILPKGFVKISENKMHELISNYNQSSIQ
jgi:hypothetical protein